MLSLHALTAVYIAITDEYLERPNMHLSNLVSLSCNPKINSYVPIL